MTHYSMNVSNTRTGMPDSWADAAPALIAVAAGRKPADLVIRNGRWVNVQSREIINRHDLAIVRGRFAYCGPDATHAIGPDTLVIDAGSRFMVPGLCDSHMHVESGMLTVSRFVEAVAPHGTTSMFVDPHEVANVLGIDGVRLVHDEALIQPINVFVQMPSCAPSAPGLETTGKEITPEDVAEAMTWPNIIGLGEMMNFPGVINCDDKMLAEIAATQRAGKTVGGHYASRDLGPAFHAYAAGGPADDHEGTREIDAVSRARQGMRAMLRLGSAWYDVEAQITAVTRLGLDPRNFTLCTDDCHSGTLVHDGHMDRVLRHAIACGCPPLVALQMATINTATHFGLEREIGSIAPGRRADVVLTGDLESFPVETVISRGQVLSDVTGLADEAKDGNKDPFPHRFSWPQESRNTVRIGRKLTPADFVVAAPAGARTVRVRVIGVVENQAPTKAMQMDLRASPEGLLDADPDRDISHVAVVERHRASGRVENGFVSGFGYRGRCALASTVAHDSHHIVVAGTCRTSMAGAVNRLAEAGGGITLFRDGKELALVHLPVAGLMSDSPAPEVAGQAQRLVDAMAECGCTMNNAFMQHSLMALVVIPELRISDLGLVDSVGFAFTDLFAIDGKGEGDRIDA